jgi:hypothetical protein
MMTQPWPEIVTRYRDYAGDWRSIRELENLARRISNSPLKDGLFGWTSMFDLRIAQTPVSYPYSGPQLLISPITDNQLEFRYFDTGKIDKQWHRQTEPDQAWQRLIGFLGQLRWFPAHILESASSEP